MDETNKIRKAYRNGDSINALAKRFSRSWTTIKKIVETSRGDLENRGKRPTREGKVITPEVIAEIDRYLEEEEQCKVWKKQRYTASTIFKDLRAKEVYKGSQRRLQEAVSQQRRERLQERPKGYLPLQFPLGSSLQFDHGEVDCVIGDARARFYLFVATVPGGVLRYCQLFPVKRSEAWGEFHERSYHFFGGIFPVSVYDNDCVLVKEVIGSDRLQTDFSYAMEEHYEIESRFCNPAAGNEKGAVENGVGYCRRNYLAGCPSFSNWAEVNAYLDRSCRDSIEQGVHYKTKKPLREIYEDLSSKLQLCLPSHKWRRWNNKVLVDSYQLAHVDTCGYSLPERFVGSRVRIGVSIFDIEIFCDEELVAKHSRLFGQSIDSLDLDHYLDQLHRKPGALWDCKAVQQHKFQPELLTVWKRLQDRNTPADANRKFIEILYLGRRYGTRPLVSASGIALMREVVEPDAVENILISLNTESRPPHDKEALEERLSHLDIDTWSCNIAQYDDLTIGENI